MIAQIYFTSYAHLKKDVFHEGYNGKKLGFGETLLAAGIACVYFLSSFVFRETHFFPSGMPAAYLVTPAGPCAVYILVSCTSNITADNRCFKDSSTSRAANRTISL